MPYGYFIEVSPGMPGNELPAGGGIDNSLPSEGDIGNELPSPPPGVWPPLTGNHPWAPIPPDATTKPPPGAIWPPLHGPNKEYWVIVGIPGIGWRYCCINPSVSVDHELPSGGHVDHTLPTPPVTTRPTPPTPPVASQTPVPPVTTRPTPPTPPVPPVTTRPTPTPPTPPAATRPVPPTPVARPPVQPQPVRR